MTIAAQRIQPAGRRGFTLVELMVVVVVLGVLATVVMPSFVRAREKSHNAAVQSNAHTVQLAIEQFALDHAGSYPARLIGSGSPDDALIDASGQNKPGYLPGDKLPLVPWGSHTRQGANIAVKHAALVKASETSASLAASDAMGKSLGLGKEPSALLGPFQSQDYGALSYDSDPASGKYVLYGTGSLNRQAVVVATAGN